MTSKEAMKKAAAEAAVDAIKPGSIIGVGTGSTVSYFIEALAKVKHRIEGAVASSIQTEQHLKVYGIPIYELNEVGTVPIYIDGADEFNDYLSLIKGGGAALTREKVIAAAANVFLCIADQTKKVTVLGRFPLPIEVIPMARSYVAREIIKLGGDPVYRENVKTDNGNEILDVHNLKIAEPIALESKLNNIPGVVTNGLFARRGADRLLMGTEKGVVELYSKLQDRE